MPKHPRPTSDTSEAHSAARHTDALPPAVLQSQHTSSAAINAYQAQFSSGTPYPHLMVRNAFSEPLLQAVRSEICAEKMLTKRNDLYDFKQSESLRQARSPATAALCAGLYSPAFRAWIGSVTGIPDLNDTVDLQAASYGTGGY
jgi:hypothetical protein